MKKYFLIALALSMLCCVKAQDKPEQPIPQLLQRLADVRSDTARLHLLLTIADAYILKPGEEKTDMDSALLLINQVEKNNTAGNDPRIHGLCLLFKAKLNRENGNIPLGKTYAFQAVEAFRRNKALYPVELAYADVEAAKYLDYSNPQEIHQRVALYQEAIPLFENTGRKEMQAGTLQIMGDCMVNGGIPLLDGLAPLLEALKIYRSIGHTDLGDLYGLLGAVYSYIGDHRNALKYGLLALAIDDSRPLSPMRYTIFNRVGVIYYDLGEYANAEIYFGKGLKVAEHFRDTNAIHELALNWVNAEALDNKFDSALMVMDQYTRQYPFSSSIFRIQVIEAYNNIYLHTNHLQLAESNIKKLMALESVYKQDGDDHLISPIFTSFYLATKDYDRARHYGERFRDYCIGKGYWHRLSNAYYLLFQIDSAQGNWEETFRQYQRYVHYHDSLLDARKNKQIAALQLEYETEKKERDIQNLTQKQQLSQLALHQASLTRNFIIAGAVLLLILLLVSVNRYRIKQRTNKKLELQQREIAERNDSLHQLVNEKDWLLKEIHHRVKNNLQVVMSLLNSQSVYIENDAALTAIHDSQHRVYSMSLIHQKLYKSDNVANIDMSDYIRELVAYLSDSFNTGGRIRFELNVAPLEMDVNQAVPFGLILNEAVTNSIKYAFPDGREGVISISLSKTTPNHCLLSISDDGIGLPAQKKKKKADSLGMTLMKGLSRNLEGHFSIENKNGTTIKIAFVHHPGIKGASAEPGSLVSNN